MQTVIFLTGVAGDGATTLKYANAHGPRFLTGYHATNKLTAATLRLSSYHDPFLPRTGGPNPRRFLRNTHLWLFRQFLQGEAKGLCAALQIADDTTAISLLILRCARVMVCHTVS